MNDLRVLIVAFDGLRPDAVTEAAMPNLVRFLRDGVHFADCRAVFPSETRVNQASLVTGCQPSRHGIVANKFVEPAAGGYIDTAVFAQLAAADAALGGGLLTAPSLGEVLKAAGGALAVLGSGTAGGNRILHHRADVFGDLNMSLHGIDKSTTPRAAEALRLVVGEFPPQSIPNRARMHWLVEAYTRVVAPRRDPTVSIIWFSDPDRPYHYRGIDSADALASIRFADAAFGRLIAWREASGMAERLQVVALSDHGHVATVGRPIELRSRLTDAGFRLGEGGDAVLVPGSCGSLYAADAERQAAIAHWLQAQAWCGPVFARAMAGGPLPPGTLPLAACGLEHARAGDIVYVLGRDGARHAGGSPGRCLHDNPDIPEGCGMHGGLNRHELSSLLACSGSAFTGGHRIDHPVGIVDVMPTLLRVLGIEAPPMDGRVLHEAFSGEAVPAARRIAAAGNGDGYAQRLAADEVAGVRYLYEGWREDAVDLAAVSSVPR
jgi:arylsulfatase A-like enzyme